MCQSSDSNAVTTLTIKYMCRGTIAYMAPELMADAGGPSEGIKENCKAADVFSLGTCMLTTATQHMPDKGCYKKECDRIMVRQQLPQCHSSL